MITIEHRGPAGAPPDPNAWRSQEGAVGGELQSYTASGNAFTDGDGHLVLEARQERTVGRYDGGQVRDYSSARLDTKGRLRIQPGTRIDVDALLPSGPGCFPALWLVGSSAFTGGAAWPACGELDIVEVAAGWRPKSVLLNLHAPYYDAKLAQLAAERGTTVDDLRARQVHYETAWTRETWRDLPGPVGDAWHTYGCHFDDNGVRLYLDGQVVMTRTRAQFDKLGVAWPWNKPMDLIANLAVKDWGDGPDKTHAVDGVWPQRMLLGPIRLSRPGELS